MILYTIIQIFLKKLPGTFYFWKEMKNTVI